MAKVTTRSNTAKKWTLAILALFLLVTIIAGTYARYTNTASGTATIDIAKWQVKIGGTKMEEITTIPVTLVYADNDYVSDNKLAPGRSATFTLEIDPTGSEVAIDYSLSIGAITGLTNNGSTVALTGATYQIGSASAENATITSGAASASFNESLADVEAGKKVTIVGTITWDNADDANNAADTENGIADQNLTASVTITARQHIQ